MPKDDRIIDEKLKVELTTLHDVYNKLDDEKRVSLRQKVPLLSGILEDINPENTTYSQIRTLARLSAGAGEFECVFGVLQRFKETEVYRRATAQNLNKLTHPPRRHIFTFMGSEEKANAEVATSRNFLHPHDRMQRLGDALLNHTIKGNQNTVEAILKRYPELLLHKGNVRDYSGREFKNATAFELAIWALDVRYMAPAMLKCVTENEKHEDYRHELVPELQKQYDNTFSESGGVTYSIGCGLLQMSVAQGESYENVATDEEKYQLLNQWLKRHNGLIEYDNKLFYFHNLRYPKKLVEITDIEAIKVLRALMNDNGIGSEFRETLAFPYLSAEYESRNSKYKRRDAFNEAQNPLIKREVDQLQIIYSKNELMVIERYVPDSRHIFREKHYDFTPLITALDTFVRSFSSSNTWSSEQRAAHWCNVVGLMQHYAPAHVAHHYCNPFKSFASYNNHIPPTFKEIKLDRTKLEVECWKLSRLLMAPWWLSSSDSASRALDFDLGLSFGILRGSDAEGWCARGINSPINERAALSDSVALRSLCKVRTGEALELKQLLLDLLDVGLRKMR